MAGREVWRKDLPGGGYSMSRVSGKRNMTVRLEFPAMWSCCKRQSVRDDTPVSGGHRPRWTL